jgi:hypothetical protein
MGATPRPAESGDASRRAGPARLWTLGVVAVLAVVLAACLPPKAPALARLRPGEGP